MADSGWNPLPPTGEIEACFTQRLGQPVRVTSVKSSFPGVSRETIIVRAEVDGRDEGFVLRLDLPWGASVPTSLRQEYEVYRRLWGSEVPVAGALWYDEGLPFAGGRPHMVRRLAEGSSIVPGLMAASAEGSRVRRAVTREHVETLARLHRLDWSARGFGDFLPAPPDAPNALRFEYERWRDLWREVRSEPFPVVTEFLCWLGEQIPDDTPFLSLTKGNNGIGEEIFRDGRIVAMTDWELASIGDGALDIAFSQGTLRLDDYDEALAYYEQCTGQRMSPERIAFATLVTRFKSMCCLNGYLLTPYLAGREPRPTAPAYGYLIIKRFEQRLAGCIGKSIVEAARSYDDKPNTTVMSLRS